MRETIVKISFEKSNPTCLWQQLSTAAFPSFVFFYNPTRPMIPPSLFLARERDNESLLEIQVTMEDRILVPVVANSSHMGILGRKVKTVFNHSSYWGDKKIPKNSKSSQDIISGRKLLHALLLLPLRCTHFRYCWYSERFFAQTVWILISSRVIKIKMSCKTGDRNVMLEKRNTI